VIENMIKLHLRLTCTLLYIYFIFQDTAPPPPGDIYAEAKNWAGELISGQTRAGKILVSGFLVSLVPRFHGSMVSWFHGSMVPWFHGSMVDDSWFHGSMASTVPRFYGALILWFHGSTVP
jgi:hypothetical protein